MILADTNILVYAINEEEPKHQQAKKFLKENLGELSVSHQNIMETIKVLTQPKFPNPMTPQSAIKAVLGIIEACQVIIPKVGTELIALELIQSLNLSGNRIFDAYLAATAISNGIEVIATDNVGDFKKFKQIKVLNPFN